MPLLSLAKSAPDVVAQFTIQQLVGTAGDGKLRDNSECSSEFREYLLEVPSKRIAEYIEQCLSTPFDKNGMVLQDMVNELGRRLEYNVTNGRYQGTKNANGFDGLWRSPEGHCIVVEVKTTDAYRISLDVIAGYGDKLRRDGTLIDKPSVLIVVGREDTGELEAQVRGSRHAWDIRLISAEALIKLVQLKENTETIETLKKIRSLLAPMEYTRLDQMIDVMFTAAKDVEQSAGVGEPEDASFETDVESAPAVLQAAEKGTWQFTDGKSLQDKRDSIVLAFGKKVGASFVKKGRALAWDVTHKRRIVSTLSKRYTRSPSLPYWFAYHPQWHSFLSEGEQGHFILGGMDLEIAFALPVGFMDSIMKHLNTTIEKSGEIYHHIKISEQHPGNFQLVLPKISSQISLQEFVFDIA